MTPVDWPSITDAKKNKNKVITTMVIRPLDDHIYIVLDLRSLIWIFDRLAKAIRLFSVSLNNKSVS